MDVDLFKGSLKGKKIFLTGGSGFVGGRLVEILMKDFDVDLKVLVRSYSSCSTIARYPIQIVKGDINNKEDILELTKNCDIIIHCAFGNSGSQSLQYNTTVKGTANILNAFEKNKLKKLVYISTVDVYGYTSSTIDESSKGKQKIDLYSKSKKKAEDLVLTFIENKDAPITILQPTIIYGPNARQWTEQQLTNIKKGLMILPSYGKNICNPVYIDDVIQSIIKCCINNKKIDGQKFLISGPQSISWEDFYSHLGNFYGKQSYKLLDRKRILELQRIKKRSETTLFRILKVLTQKDDIRQGIQRLPFYQKIDNIFRILLPKKIKIFLFSFIKNKTEQIFQDLSLLDKYVIPDNSIIELFELGEKVNIDKARNNFGYDPKFSFEQGMRLTKKWAKWSKYI